MKQSQSNVICNNYCQQTKPFYSLFADNSPANTANYTMWLGSNEFAWAIFHTSE